MKNPKAFPRPHSADAYAHQQIESQEGMTLRDYFAAKALQGFCGDREQWHALMMDSKGKGDSSEYVAKQMYEVADAMLIERNKD